MPAVLRLLRPRLLLGLLGAGALWQGCAPDAERGAAPAPAVASPAVDLDLDAVPMAAVVLVDAGASERSPLRLVSPEPGARRELRVQSRFVVTPTQDGATLSPRELTETRRVQVIHEAVDDAGLSTYSVALRSLSRAGAPAPSELIGRTARWTVDRQGRVHSRGLDRAGLSPAALAQLDQMLGGVAELFVPLPAEALGKGARWTVTETIDHADGTETRTTTWMLVDRDARGFVLTGETEGRLVPAAPATGPHAPGLRERSLLGETRLAVSTGTALPDRVDSRGRSTRDAVVARPDGGMGRLRTETEWTTIVDDAPAAPVP